MQLEINIKNENPNSLLQFINQLILPVVQLMRFLHLLIPRHEDKMIQRHRVLFFCAVHTAFGQIVDVVRRRRRHRRDAVLLLLPSLFIVSTGKIPCAHKGWPCARGLCANVVRRGCARRVVRTCVCSVERLCAGIVRSIVRNGVRSLCACRVQSLVRIERQKGFALSKKTLFERHKVLSLVHILFH